MVPLIAMFLILPLIAFALWMFSDMIKNDNLRTNSRSNWILLFFVLNVFGAIMYYINEYRTQL